MDSWKIRLDKPAKKELSRLDRQAQADIWSYRVIVDIRDQELVVLVVRVGHRKNVYGK
ncbi:MAG: type II toxin-antitoxin system RelE/ParE family toxin [Desulfovermiculus sp.]|nr:type II toxin-antitoxin system RelE/ParE family toxin [Desulfovermiculus sp.]